MKKWFYLLVVCAFVSTTSFAQKMTVEEILLESQKFHDPSKKWSKLNAQLNVVSKTPDKSDRLREVFINNKKGIFKMKAQYPPFVSYEIKGDDIIVKSEDSDDTNAVGKKNYATKEYALLFRNYYSYLYGLPMNLIPEQNLIDRNVEEVLFNETECYRLRLKYEEPIGTDTWYFYFDNRSFEMIAYQFYKDESKNDGEYILLEGLEEINGIKFPKSRYWYYNNNGAYLGTDVLKPQE